MEAKTMNELTSMVTEITELHYKITTAIKKTLQDAIRIGELLKEQKDKMPHGVFTSWIKENLPFSDRTARNYMRVHESRERLKTESVSVLNGAYKMIMTTKEDRLSAAEQERLNCLEEIIDTGLKKIGAAGLSIDDILKYVEARVNA
jgi:hypothetical protein